MTRPPTRAVLPLLAAASLALTACSDDTSGATQETSSSAASSGATESSADVGPSWKLLSTEPGGVRLPAGAYALAANGDSNHLALVQAPEGYQNDGGWTFVTDAPFRAMGFLTADRVPPDPCGSARHSKFAR